MDPDPAKCSGSGSGSETLVLRIYSGLWARQYVLAITSISLYERQDRQVADWSSTDLSELRKIKHFQRKNTIFKEYPVFN